MKLCKCGKRHTAADVLRDIWGFQRSGVPGLADLGLFDCAECESTLGIELATPAIQTREYQHVA